MLLKNAIPDSPYQFVKTYIQLTHSTDDSFWGGYLVERWVHRCVAKNSSLFHSFIQNFI